jgi:thiosulfate/3-mercaptopyruvate sulfurtransferase
MSLLRSRRLWICLIAGLILVALAWAAAAAECDTLKKPGEKGCDSSGSEWDPTEKLDEIGTGVADKEQAATAANWPERSREMRWNQSAYGFNDSNSSESSSESETSGSESSDAGSSDSARSSSFDSVLAPLKSVSNYDVILDVSDGETQYIPGAVHIDYMDFLDGSRLKSVSDLSQILGNAGISQSDSVIIYGECQPCGGGPSVSTYAYWILRYLGHEDVKVLDGGINDWIAAGMPVSNQSQIRPKTEYDPVLRPELLATYEYVKSGSARVIDARSTDEYNNGSIPGAINIPYEQVLDGTRIKGEDQLEALFGELSREMPVVVYTNTGVKASMVWFALELMGYDARVYSWQDWYSNQPTLPIVLKDITASPNPANSGDAVKITAIFGNDTSSEEEPASPSNETILTVKGCATCGFGSPQAFAGVNPTGTNSDAVRLDSAGISKSDAFACVAYIYDSEGTEVKRVNLQRTVDDIYAGTWNANVDAGTYNVGILASAGTSSKAFGDALSIEVTGSNADSGTKRLGSY